jgi:hypothetical protein
MNTRLRILGLALGFSILAATEGVAQRVYPEWSGPSFGEAPVYEDGGNASQEPSIGVTAAWTVVRGILIAGTLTVQAIKPAFHNSTIALSGRGAGNSLAHCG